jgi:hypothetical protein
VKLVDGELTSSSPIHNRPAQPCLSSAGFDACYDGGL